MFCHKKRSSVWAALSVSHSTISAPLCLTQTTESSTMSQQLWPRHWRDGNESTCVSLTSHPTTTCNTAWQLDMRHFLSLNNLLEVRYMDVKTLRVTTAWQATQSSSSFYPYVCVYTNCVMETEELVLVGMELGNAFPNRDIWIPLCEIPWGWRWANPVPTGVQCYAWY